MTQTSTSRRVATVSGGALLLCLSFGGTALAATGPASGSDASPLGGLTNPLPLPTPTDTPNPVDTVTQTVQQVSHAAGVPVPSPTATSTAHPVPAPSGGKPNTGKHAHVPVAKPAHPGSQEAVLGVQHTRVAPMPTGALAGVQFGGLRGAGAAPAVTNPVVAPVQTAILAAGQTPALAPRPEAVLPLGPLDERAPRGLFIALATMVIGGLAAGHVKVIQDRLNGIAAV
jgi:hypothetical protein